MSEPYVYAPLPGASAFRLLQLIPGLQDEALSCSIMIFSDITKAPRYQALSYCWGSPMDRTVLKCNKATLEVTKNLYTALHRLRRRQQCQFIWADAICIDQENILERSQQVSMMDEIYRHASIVFIWIADEHQAVVEVAEMIRIIVNRCHLGSGSNSHVLEWAKHTALSIDNKSIVSSSACMGATDFKHSQWECFGRFFEASWFFRVWVIQEVRQSEKVWLLCGDAEIEWNMLALAATWVWLGALSDQQTHWKKEYFSSYVGFINANFMWDKALSTRREAPFLTVLQITRPFRSTDPLDKVFAMMHHQIHQIGLDRHGNIEHLRTLPDHSSITLRSHLGIVANYKLSRFKVFHDVASKSLLHYRNLEVLCYAWQTARHSSDWPDWPSWVPKWDVPNSHVLPVLLPFLYDAAKGFVFDYSGSFRQDTLCLKGLNLGYVAEISPVLRYRDGIVQDEGTSSVQNELFSMMRMLTQDSFWADPTNENSATRSQPKLTNQFANFAAYVNRLLPDTANASFLSLYSIWCQPCQQYVTQLTGQATSEPPEYYHCPYCRDGDEDICVKCYEDRGVRCSDEKHNMRKLKSTGILLPSTNIIRQILAASAEDGDYEHFNRMTNLSCRRAAFFTTSKGWRGTASVLAEQGDIVAILFGSRLPFILRKHGLIYRLVSECYVDGIMDGRALQMWQNGELDEEEFLLR